MKKRLLAILLVLASLASMLVAPVGAATTAETNSATVTSPSGACPCGCGQMLDAVTWQPWDVSGVEGPTSGHYYLESDYIQDGQKQIMAGDHVVLDLRGHTITSKSYSRLLLVYGQMHVLDTVGGGRFMSKTSGGAFGGVVMVSTNEVNDTLFALHSGTVTQDPDNKGSRRGGLIHISETATFRMTGGMLLNGSTVIAGGTYAEPGGCVAGVSASGTIEILGGKIIGGESATHGGSIYNVGTTILKNCEISGGVAAKIGGNIYQYGGSLTIENCVISDGEAKDSASGNGGNIAISGGATMQMKDSTVGNGFANYHGGNIYIGSASVTMEASKIEAGVARVRGNNLYGSTSATGLTITDCDLPGDIGYVGENLTLSGQVKIGLLNHGLRLAYGADTAVADASGLESGSEIYVVAKHTFTTPGADADYFKGAIRTVITPSQEGLVATYAENGALGGYCPHCNQQVVWKSFDIKTCVLETCLNDSTTDTDPACTGRHVASGHYYLGATPSSWTQPYAGASYDPEAFVDVVLDTAGYSVTTGGRFFYVRTVSGSSGQSSLTMLDSYGGSKLTGSGANNQPGGVIYNESSKLTIYGGNYVYKPVSGRNVTGGGVVLNGDSFTMHGGILDGSAFTYTDASTADKTYTYNGGALNQYDGTKYDFTMTAGRVNGGTAQSGGCAFFGYNNTVNITGGQFSGGVAQTAAGGCIRMNGKTGSTKGVFNMSGTSVRDGRLETTGVGGGNLSVSYGTANLNDCYIEGGYAAAYGGNIMVGSTVTLNVTNCVIEGGYAAAQSGNVHMSSTSSTTNWTDCLVLNGSATTGGNMTSGNGNNTIQGGQILYGIARTSYGGNISAISGNHTAGNYTKFLSDVNGNTPLVAGGEAKTYGGNLYVGGITELAAAKLVNGKAATLGQDLYVAKGSNRSSLTVAEGFTGECSVGFATALLTGEVYGKTIDRTACDTLNATMVMEGNYNNAVLCAKDGTLHVGAIAVVDGQGGYTWYTDTASAVENCDENGYVKLFIAQDVVLTKDCAVDLCGQTVAISGAYTLYGMDSSGDGYTTPTGRALLAEETKLATDVTLDGKRYITSQDESGAMFHRLENRISGVALRPSADGIYFTGSFGCDETLVADIASYGVAVSTVNMPGSDFMTDEDTLYTSFSAEGLVGGAQNTGVLINGIMKEERSSDLNSAYGQMPVFAASYLTLKDGTVIISQQEVGYSLHSMMAEVDSRIVNDPLNFRVLTNPMRDFYAKWEADGMESWEFQKIIPPQEDDVLNILMIGSSGCYYYVEELYGLLEAAGIKANVCNVYYSGGKLYQHYNWWVGKKSNYEYFCTNENGRVKTANVSLEWCLAQQEWDVLTLQESGLGAFREITPEQALADRELYLTSLYGYLMEQFPKAEFYWHESSAYQVGYDRGDFTVTCLEDQIRDTENFRKFALLISEKYNVGWIPRGEGKLLARLGGYDQLSARLGKGNNHEGDYYHAGDIGGGQYLTACVWFETLTGLSCVGSPYRPVYTYNGKVYELNEGITYEQLQQYGHEAVEFMRTFQ